MRRQVITFMIADWEIECCAPPPVLGAESTWKLEFIADDDEIAQEHIWTVTHDPRGVAFLDRDGFQAVWNDYRAPAPPPGIHTLRGVLHGTVHDDLVPDDLAAVTGRVQRIRLVSHEFEWDPHEPRTLQICPGTRDLHDIRESPRGFSDGPSGPGRHDTDLLLDLAVPAR